jgi:dihydrolipoamide dehydrogenase
MNIGKTMQAAQNTVKTELAVLGGGPGGYTAAFRAADLGRKVVLIDAGLQLGGVCLNVGCIPSKNLLHTAKAILDAQTLDGVRFGAPTIDLAAMRAGKDRVIAKLTRGLALLARQRGITVLQGEGRFTGPHGLRVTSASGVVDVAFTDAIIACGSEPMRIPGLPPGDPRIMDSTAALELPEIPQRLLVVGGGIIGLEMAAVYHALGARITVVERLGQLLPGADPDLVQPLAKRLAARYERIHLLTEMQFVSATADGIRVRLAGPSGAVEEVFGRVLVAVGRRPNGARIDAAAAGVTVDARGFIAVDAQMRTNVAHIYAVGDVVGEPMLAHKATHEAKVAAEVICGHAVRFDARSIPSVAYTDPEIAWMGLTETQAKADNIAYERSAIAWQASGRAQASGVPDGLTKLLIDPKSRRILGAGIVGASAGDLIAEAVLALEMDAEAGDLALTIHPHPTFSETLAMAAEWAEGSITDLIRPRNG